MKNKIFTKKNFVENIRPELKKQGKKIALCHGVFDLVHPGHLAHLKQAADTADVLVVSITSSRFVRKGPGRPYFDDDTRMNFLAALECVDYVILSEEYTAKDIIETVEPDFYVKGEEYADEDGDVTGKIRDERELVEKHGGKIFYTTGQTYSSTKLINNALEGLSSELKNYMLDFKTRYSMADIKNYADEAGKLKILVVGDVIIDRYTYCDVQGLISKEASYSARLKGTENYLGGSLAIARHLSSFFNSSSNITLLSVIGDDDETNNFINCELGDKISLKLINSKIFPSIIKHRYLTQNDRRGEYRKIFTINNIPYNPKIDEESALKLKDFLSKNAANYDAVFICDFGHGLIDDETINIMQNEAKFIALNCQTNSSNIGLNIITKYKKASVFSLDQREIKLAFPVYAGDEKAALNALSEHLGCGGWLTRGSEGAWGLEYKNKNKKIYSSPACTLKVKDTVGAGDAFYSAAALFAAVGAPNEASLFVGNVAGALGANIVGNKDAVEKVNILKFASTLMNV